MLKTIPELIKLASANIRKITAAHAQTEIPQNNGILIDVREPAEFNEKAAVGSINIPRGILEMRLVEQIKDENFAIFLHCATSGRAVLAAESLQRLGYNNVTVISCKFADIEQVFRG